MIHRGFNWHFHKIVDMWNKLFIVVYRKYQAAKYIREEKMNREHTLIQTQPGDFNHMVNWSILEVIMLWYIVSQMLLHFAYEWFLVSQTKQEQHVFQWWAWYINPLDRVNLSFQRFCFSKTETRFWSVTFSLLHVHYLVFLPCGPLEAHSYKKNFTRGSKKRKLPKLKSTKD